MVRRVLLIVGLGLLGVLAAASIGYASYLVSRDDVGLPVTKLEQAPRDVVPVPGADADPADDEHPDGNCRRSPGSRASSRPTTTGDDNSGRGRGSDDNSGKGSSGSGSGSDSSGKGSGGDDDFDDD